MCKVATADRTVAHSERVVGRASPTPAGARHQRSNRSLRCHRLDDALASRPEQRRWGYTVAAARAHWSDGLRMIADECGQPPLAASGRGRAQRTSREVVGAKADWDAQRTGQPLRVPSGPRGTGRRERGLGSSG